MESNQVVGQYRMDEKIGEGGMAEVWIATQTSMENQWAVKFLRPSLAGDPELEKRFLEEARKQGGLKHPNIVSATNFFQDSGHSYLVMDYIPGTNLEQRLKSGSGLPLNDVLYISECILNALGFAHERRYVHRDVKPSNVLLDTENGWVYLSDFGIALAMDEDNRVTKTGTAVGTPDYMSPEQITAKSPVDTRSDIYSFGCVLYAMLTGIPPFAHAEATEFEVKHGHVYRQPPPIKERNAKVTDEIEQVVLKCMAKQPSDRYQTCAEVFTALNAAIQAARLPKPEQPPIPKHDPVVVPPAKVLPPGPGPVVTPPAVTVAPPAKNPMSKILMAVSAFCLVGVLIVVGLMIFSKKGAGNGQGGGGTAPVVQGTVTAPIMLRLEGSTTIGDELAAALVRGWLANSLAKDVKEQLTMNAKKERTFLFQAVMSGKSSPEAISIVANGSGAAFKALKGGTADIGMSSRAITDAEMDSLKPFNMKLATTEIVVGMDGIAIVVNQANTVPELTLKQVAGIFSGQITNWSEVGGANEPISMFGRDKSSGTYKTFLEDVLGNKEASYSPQITAKANGDEIASAVSQTRGGVGYVSLAQIKGVKALAISYGPGTQSLKPGPFTVATEDYALSRRLYLYVTKESPLESEFITFAASPEGQAIVKKVGFVDQVGEFQRVDVPANAPAEYRNAVAGRQRMRLNFRFETNSDHLDNKAMADLDRAVDGLAKSGIHEVSLLGFADSVGNFDTNRELSLRRARIVAAELEKQHIRADVYGMSYQMPLAIDKGPDGKLIPEPARRNRRVELWALVP